MHPTDRGRRSWPLWGALALLWAAMIGLVWASLRRTDGHYVYTLDDAYIHMAIAKHFVRDGVWGVTPYEFSSSSSSPLWTALLALAYRIFGLNELAPLVLNVVFATLTVGVLDRALRDRLGDRARFLTLLAAIVLSRLPVVALTGMEHTLQMALVTAFVFRSATLLASGDGTARTALPLSVVAMAALLPMTRYEGLFTVFAVAGAMLLRRRVRHAALLAAAAIVPVAIYGAVSVGHGWFAVPNSVLVKGARGGLVDWLTAVPKNLAKARALGVVLAVAGTLFIVGPARTRAGWPAGRVLLGLFLAIALLHVQFAAVGWFYRYEAYLIVLGVGAIAAVLFGPATPTPAADSATTTRALRVARIATVALGLVVAVRTSEAFRQSPVASQNIYQQQYQMGRFLASAYPGQVVAANDIGAIDYLADLRCLDLMGLASMPIARLRLVERRTRAEDVDRVVQDSDARIAVAYESWFRGDYITEDRIPPRWGAPVARWTIRDNVACGGDTVSFFALAPGERDSLRAKLDAFAPRLPEAVTVR